MSAARAQARWDRRQAAADDRRYFDPVPSLPEPERWEERKGMLYAGKLYLVPMQVERIVSDAEGKLFGQTEDGVLIPVVEPESEPEPSAPAFDREADSFVVAVRAPGGAGVLTMDMLRQTTERFAAAEGVDWDVFARSMLRRMEDRMATYLSRASYPRFPPELARALSGGFTRWIQADESRRERYLAMEGTLADEFADLVYQLWLSTLRTLGLPILPALPAEPSAQASEPQEPIRRRYFNLGDY